VARVPNINFPEMMLIQIPPETLDISLKTHYASEMLLISFSKAFF
jgi:hypothetical protein